MSTWTPLGPAPIVNGARPGGGPVSGRVTGIAAHPSDPNTIYVAAAGGGVWKTTNGGTSWTPLTDFASTLSMGALAIAPSNPLVIYAGTGEANNSGDSNFGRGVLVSTDGGNTWALRNNGGNFDRRTISEIAIDPTNSNVVYVAVAGGGVNGLSGNTGIWKTSNGGVTWTNTTGAIASDLSWSSIRIDPTNPGTLYAAVWGGAPGGVYKSTNGGISWNLLAGAVSGTAAGRIVVAVAKSNPQVVYVSAASNATGGLYKFMRSDDGGSTFTDLTVTTLNYMENQGWYDTTLIVDPTSSGIVYAAGSSIMLRSVNSGVTFADIGFPSGGPHVDHHAAAFDANGKYLDGDDGGIYRFDDPTTFTWTQLNGNLNTIQFYGVALHPTDSNIALGGSQDNGISKYTGSLGWTLLEGGDGGLVKFSKTNPLRVYHQAPVDSYGSCCFFRRSDDGGTTWVSETTGITDAAQDFYAPFAVDPGNGDRVLYGATHVWESTNGGNTWTVLGAAFTGNVAAIGLSASDFNTIYVYAGNLFVTHNHGATWEQRDLPVFGLVADIQVDPTNPLTAYAAVRTFTGGGNVFATTNGGVTWTNIGNGLPSVPAWSLQIDPASPGTLYLGSEAGVYRTTNLGATWSPFGAGLPNAQVFQIELNPALRILAAATHGRGMWEISVSAAPTVAAPASATPNPVTAATTNLSVLGADDLGEANLAYTWAATGTPPAPVTFSANGTNAAKNVVATFTKAGNYGFQVTITDQSNLTATSAVNVTVNQTLTRNTVAPASATVPAGTTQQFTATALDQFNAALLSQPSYTWTVSGGGTISTSGLFTAGSTAGGPFTVTAASGGINGTATVTVTASTSVVTYVQGAGISSDTGDTSIAKAFTAANTSGNLIVAAISWGSSASVTCSDSLGNTYSVATTQYDIINNQSLAICYAANVKSGANTVTATLSGSTAYRRLLIHEYQGIAPANAMDVVAKNVAIGTTASNAITSTSAVTTSSGELIFGAVMDDDGVTGITAGTGFTQRQSMNNKDLATEDLVQAASGSIAATQTFGASHRYLAQMVAFKASVTATAPPTVASPASASPNPVTAATTNLSVLGADNGGEASLIYTWATIGTPPAPVTFSVNGTNAAKNVVATFTKAGNYSFQVTITDQGNLTVTSAVNLTVNQTLTRINVAPASATVTAGATQQFTATALDQFNAALLSQPSYTWTVSGGGTISTTGLFTAGSTAGGPFTVTAANGGINGTASATVTPLNAPPTVAAPASATPNPVTAATTNLSVLGADDGGEANLIYTWAATGTPPAPVTFSVNGTNAAKNVVATFTKAGNYSFQVTITDQGNLTVPSAVNVTVNQTLTRINVAPASATVTAGATQQFAATALDQFNAALLSQPSYTWMVSGGGTISPTGLFTAGSTAGGPFTVTAANGGINGTATVTVTASPSVVTYVQGAGTTTDTAATSIARAFTAANASGNLIVAAISWGSSASVTCSDSQNNTYSVATTQYDIINNQSLAICYAANVKSGANTVTATFSGSTAYRRLLIHEYQGIAPVSPVDIVAKNVANGTTASNAITSTSAVPTSSGELIFGAVMDDNGVTGITAGTGFTQRQSVNNKDLATEDLVQAASGSVASTQTFGASHRYLAQMVAFKHR